ncbi:unnamed protein product [Haemonchus placei]|uniref:Secreted protein n=1 Tax=Haemonchus placei TaxID=6290 RepID=A0A0N4X215_HAEPC|nr:unnamed protein product [Haemonchus placei]
MLFGLAAHVSRIAPPIAPPTQGGAEMGEESHTVGGGDALSAAVDDLCPRAHLHRRRRRPFVTSTTILWQTPHQKVN